MGSIKRFRLLTVATALLAVLGTTLLQAPPAQASHFRGSMVTVEYHAPSGANSAEVHVTSTTLTRKSSPDGMYGVNVYINNGGTLTPVTCNSTSTQTLDTNNPIFEIQQDVFTLDGCFSTPGDYVFESTSCCRISGILNTPNSSIQFQSQIHIDGINDSSAPVYNSGYMYNIAYDAALSYSTNLGGVGQGNTAVTYSLVDATGSAINEYGATRIPCSDLDTSTGQFRVNSTYCTGTETIVGAYSGGQKLYALKVRATDVNGQYATRDVLLNFDTTANQSPAFTSTPLATSFTVAPGATSVAQFCAQDPDAADTLNFTSAPARSWITMGTVSANTGTTPTTYCVDFTIAPPVGTAEAFNFEVSVYDNYANFVRSASGLYSVQAGAVVPTPIIQTPPATDPTNPVVETIVPRNVVLGQETKVTISGYRLSGVEWLTLNGNKITVLANDSQQIVFLVPVQTGIEYGEVEFKATGGLVTWIRALKFVPAAKAPAAVSSALSVKGFAPGSSVLNANLKTQLNKLATTLTSATKIVCNGLTTGTNVNSADVLLSRARATVTCGYLKAKLGSGIKYVIVAQTLGAPNGNVRGVDITYAK